MLARNEFTAMLEQFRRRLAAEIEARWQPGGIEHADVDIGSALADRDMLQLSALELNELRRVVQPLARQLAGAESAAIGGYAAPVGSTRAGQCDAHCKPEACHSMS